MKKKVHVVGAVIENEHNEILCALRSPNMVLANLWEFPGGKIEQGETPEQCLIREIDEELGCTIEVHELVEDVVHEYPTFIVHLLTYRASLTAGQPIAREHAELKWVPRQELEALEWAPADVPTIKKLIQ